MYVCGALMFCAVFLINDSRSRLDQTLETRRKSTRYVVIPDGSIPTAKTVSIFKKKRHKGYSYN